MTNLDERLSGIDRLSPPDLWERAQSEAQDGLPGTTDLSVGRRFAIIAAALTIGIAAVAWVVIAIQPTPTSPPVVADQPVLAPAPRTDCPTGLVRENPVETPEFVDLMDGYLPTWMPEGFGLLATFGQFDTPTNGPTGLLKTFGHGIWSDESCREVELLFNPSDKDQLARGGIRPTVGPWTIESDAPGECGNAVLGMARCLRYSAATPDGLLSLSMMGLDRDEGDRIALSIFSTESPPATTTLLVSSSGPSGDDAGLSGTLTIENGCVAVATAPALSVYVVWPAGYSLADEEGETWLVDDSGNQVARVGDEIQMGGGITDLAHAEPSVPGGIPSSCEVGGPDAYWFAGTPELVDAEAVVERLGLRVIKAPANLETGSCDRAVDVDGILYCLDKVADTDAEAAAIVAEIRRAQP